MLSAEGCAKRRNRLWDKLPEEYEWALITDPRHVLYFSGFLVNPISFSTLERGFLLLDRSGGSMLIADNFAIRSAAEEPFVDDVVLQNWYDHRNSVENRDRILLNGLQSVRDRMQGKPGLVESEWTPVMVIDELKLAPETRSLELGSSIRSLRRQKEPDEIRLIEQCARACEAGHARALQYVRPGVSELDVFREVQSAATEQAGQACVVYGDFRAVNADTPRQGGLPGGYEVRSGDLLILDYSVVLHGYRCDFTNTIAVDTPSAEQQRLLDVCKAAMDAGENVLRSGVEAAAVYSSVSEVMVEAGFPDLIHHAGHGLGLGHPEPPILVPESTDTLLAGDVVTLEPGIYQAGVGGLRIEHNYLVTDHGCRKLSNHRLTLKQ